MRRKIEDVLANSRVFRFLVDHTWIIMCLTFSTLALSVEMGTFDRGCLIYSSFLVALSNWWSKSIKLRIAEGDAERDRRNLEDESKRSGKLAAENLRLQRELNRTIRSVSN